MPDTCRTFLHFSSFPPQGLLISFSEQQARNPGQNCSTTRVGLIRVLKKARSPEPCSLQDQLNTTVCNSLHWAALIYSKKKKDFFFHSPFFSLQGLSTSGHFFISFRWNHIHQWCKIKKSIYKLSIKLYQLAFWQRVKGIWKQKLILSKFITLHLQRKTRPKLKLENHLSSVIRKRKRIFSLRKLQLFGLISNNENGLNILFRISWATCTSPLIFLWCVTSKSTELHLH